MTKVCGICGKYTAMMREMPWVFRDRLRNALLERSIERGV
nr:MAG TPA: 50S ribosomal protein L2 [Caudoviricetes sp.]